MLKTSYSRSFAAKFLLLALFSNLLMAVPVRADFFDPLADTDLDTMLNGWELDHCTDFEVDDAALDDDSDGVTNLGEFTAGTDSCDTDSDDDELTDGDEINVYLTNPLLVDTDGDGRNDGAEVDDETDPTVAGTPNLTVTSITLFDNIAEELISSDALPEDADPSLYTIRYTVENLGTVSVGAANNTVAGFTSVDQDGAEFILYDWTELGNFGFLRFDNDSTFPVVELTNDNSLLADVLSFEFCVDTTNTVLESNEEDNCLSFDNPFFVAPVEETPVPEVPAAPASSGAGFVAQQNSDVTVEDISADVILSTEEVATCGTLPFVDVAAEDISYSSIYHLWCEGVVHGRDATHYVPADPLRRDEASKITARLFGYAAFAYVETPELSMTSFMDLSTVEPLAYYVQILTDNDFFYTEKNLGVFRPHDQITYGEASALLTKVSGSKVSLDGYESTDLIDRGTFATLAFASFE